jgi:hypothetical protein
MPLTLILSAVTRHRFLRSGLALRCFEMGHFRKPAATGLRNQSADKSAHSKLWRYVFAGSICRPNTICYSTGENERRREY